MENIVSCLGVCLNIIRSQSGASIINGVKRGSNRRSFQLKKKSDCMFTLAFLKTAQQINSKL